MGVSDDDDDLKRAIALSLGKIDPASASAKEVIDLDSDGEGSVRREHGSSRTKTAQVVDLKRDETTTDEESPPPPVTAKAEPMSKPIHSMLGLDRKAMEQERLARKRRTSISPPPSGKKTKLATSAPEVQRLTTLAKPKSTTTWQSTQPNIPTASSSGHAQVPTASSPTNLKFSSGTVKKTWALGQARDSSDLKLEEVLQRHDLTLAVLSSFQWDVEWLLGKIDSRKTQMVFVMQAKEDSVRQQYRRETADMPNLRLCFPPMEGQVNCMHSKLMLLSHPAYLRIVVATANLVPYDWGETGVMENSLFLIDLPRLPDGKSTSPTDMTPFGLDLIYFLEAMGLDPKIIQSIYNFDFSATSNYAFVHTIGGTHTREAWRRTGYCGLGRAIQQLNLQTSQNLKIDFVASSIGSLNYDFLSALYLAAQGDDGLFECERRNAVQVKSKAGKTAREKSLAAQADLIKILRENFRIYFPSHETVANSTGGTDCGGTICFQSKWFRSPEFPSEMMRDCKSVRRGLLMHNKVRSCPSYSFLSLASSLLARSRRLCHATKWINLIPRRKPSPSANPLLESLDPLRPPHPLLNPSTNAVSLSALGLHRLRKLLRKRLGETIPRPHHQKTKAKLPELGMRRNCTDAV